MFVENVTIGYGNRVVLRNITMRIEKGEFVFLIGSSGSGKTSFIKMLIGDIRPKSGNMVDDTGKVVSAYSTTDLAEYRRRVGVVFQDYKLLKSRTVRENVAFAMEVCGYRDRQIVQRVPEVLSQVGLLQKSNNFIDVLSGGEAQRVAIARALIHDPDILIGDEPTGNLDPTNTAEILEILLELHRAGKTIILATHDEKIVNQMKKRVITFKNGQVFSDVEGGTYNA